MVKIFWYTLAQSLALGLVLLLAPSVSDAQTQQPLSAFVDRTNITINDVITLTLRLDVSLGGSRPSLTGLNQQFEQVGGVSSRSTYTNTNGNIQAWTEYSLMLRPLSTGTLTIPAFRVGNETSQPIQITVADAASSTGGSSDEIFLRTSISKTASYVQEQLLYTIKIYYAIGFDQGAQLSAPQVDNAVVQQLGSDNNYQEVLEGISYNVTERRFVMFPQQSGDFRIPPVTFNATVGRRGGINRFFNNRQTVREINLVSEEHVVSVKPTPEEFDGQTWLPAAALQLTETWSGDKQELHVGDAITRNITITTEGLSSSLLPAINFAPVEGLRFYPDQPTREDAANTGGVIGTRAESTAIVASQPGEFSLPEVQLPWWNTAEDRLELATLPARVISILPPVEQPDLNSVNPGLSAAAGSTTTDPADRDGAAGSNPLWIASTLLFAGLWAVTALLLVRSRQQLMYVETTTAMAPPPTLPENTGSKGRDRRAAASDGSPAAPEAAAALRVLKMACESGRLADVRRALLKWGQGVLQEPQLLTLAQLAERFADAGLTAEIRRLDQALYGGGEQGLETATLYELAARLTKQGPPRSGSGDPYALRSLY